MDTRRSERVSGKAGLAKSAPLVLVVDPDEDARALLRLLFESVGLTVAECSGGERVVDELARLRPDLAIIEERLPHVDGRTICLRLRAAENDLRHTPVIFTSTSSDPASARLAFEAGCTLYFLKPFDLQELMEAATELIIRSFTHTRA